IAQVPDAVRAVHPLGLIRLPLGLIVVALLEELAGVGQDLDRFFLVALAARRLDFADQLVGRILEEAPAGAGGIGLESQFLGLVELAVIELFARLAEQGTRIAIGLGFCLALGLGFLGLGLVSLGHSAAGAADVRQ